jgi:hypothetical protein
MPGSAEDDVLITILLLEDTFVDGAELEDLAVGLLEEEEEDVATATPHSGHNPG